MQTDERRNEDMQTNRRRYVGGTKKREDTDKEREYQGVNDCLYITLMLPSLTLSISTFLCFTV